MASWIVARGRQSAAGRARRRRPGLQLQPRHHDEAAGDECHADQCNGEPEKRGWDAFHGGLIRAWPL